MISRTTEHGKIKSVYKHDSGLVIIKKINYNIRTNVSDLIVHQSACCIDFR